MKKIILLFVVLFSVAMQAQSTVTLVIQWDPNPASENIVSYNIQITGSSTPPAQVVTPGAACNATVCQAFFNNVPIGNYTASVAATNEWGSGPAGTGTISMTIPTAPKNVRGRKG